MELPKKSSYEIPPRGETRFPYHGMAEHIRRYFKDDFILFQTVGGGSGPEMKLLANSLDKIGVNYGVYNMGPLTAEPYGNGGEFRTPIFPLRDTVEKFRRVCNENQIDPIDVAGIIAIDDVNRSDRTAFGNLHRAAEVAQKNWLRDGSVYLGNIICFPGISQFAHERKSGPENIKEYMKRVKPKTYDEHVQRDLLRYISDYVPSRFDMVPDPDSILTEITLISAEIASRKLNVID